MNITPHGLGRTLASCSSKPLITTIIPTYRRPHLLARAIRSVLAQTYGNFQLWVFDDASEDETTSVVQRFIQNDSRVQYHRRPTNVGLCRNFAEASMQVDTPFFSFLSNDDVLLPDFYETALGNFEAFPEIMMSATAAINTTDRGEVLKIPMLNWRPGLYLPPHGMLSMIINGHPDWAGVLFRRELLRLIGPPDVDLGPPFDVDFELRAAAHFPIAVSLRPGALFIVHDGSAGLLAGLDGLCPGWHKMTQKIIADEIIVPNVKARAVRLLKRPMRGMLLRASLAFISRGDWLQADRSLRYLRSYSRVWSSILKVLFEICKCFEPLRRILLGLMSLRRMLLRSSPLRGTNTHLQSQFGSYSRYLQL